MDHEERLFRSDDEVGVYLQVPLYEETIEEASEEWFNILVSCPCDINEEGILIMASDRDRALFLEARHSLPANSLEIVKQRGTTPSPTP